MIVGPLLMSVGDLIHPPEDWATAVQVALVVEAPTGWYAAHLLLFVGLLLFVPGIAAIGRLAASRRPRAGYAAGILLFVSVGAVSGVFVFEMLLGRFISEGANQADAVALLDTFQSPAVFAALVPGLLAFFAGTGLAVFALASSDGPFRWPALALGLGACLIMAEIISAQVLLSQIGNIVMLVAGVGFARVLMRAPEAVPAVGPSPGRRRAAGPRARGESCGGYAAPVSSGRRAWWSRGGRGAQPRPKPPPPR